MRLTASSPDWISRPSEGSAWQTSKRSVLGLTNSNDGFRLMRMLRLDRPEAASDPQRCSGLKRVNLAGQNRVVHTAPR